MNYLSPSEIAKEWKISKSRVIVLASEGRIPGVKRVGNNWMIPENAIKPSDKRCKKNKTDDSYFEYRFPLFMYGPHPNNTLMSTLTNDEKLLLEAQLAFCRCDYEYCVNILNSIVGSVSNIYTEIGTLYMLCLSSAYCNKPDCFRSSLSKLEDIYLSDFPYKKDFAFLFYDIHSLYLGNDIFIYEFSMDPEYNYSADILPLIALQTTYAEMLLGIKEHRSSVPYHLELMCLSYEQNHYYFLAQRLHLYIGLLCAGTDHRAEAYYHLKRVIELGIKYEGYEIITTSYLYCQKYYDEILKDYDPEIIKKLQDLSRTLQNNIKAFLGSETAYINKIMELTSEEHHLMAYAIKKLSNKEISEITGIPEYTIRRKYEKLFNRFNIANKAKLGELYISMLTAGYK